MLLVETLYNPPMIHLPVIRPELVPERARMASALQMQTLYIVYTYTRKH